MTFATLEVPLAHVSGVRTVRVSGMQRSVETEDERLTVSIMGSANVEIEFDRPVRVTGDRTLAARSVRFYADRPPDVVRHVEELAVRA